jgi:hypothetical protein
VRWPATIGSLSGLGAEASASLSTGAGRVRASLAASPQHSASGRSGCGGPDRPSPQDVELERVGRRKPSPSIWLPPGLHRCRRSPRSGARIIERGRVSAFGALPLDCAGGGSVSDADGRRNSRSRRQLAADIRSAAQCLSTAVSRFHCPPKPVEGPTAGTALSTVEDDESRVMLRCFRRGAEPSQYAER